MSDDLANYPSALLSVTLHAATTSSGVCAVVTGEVDTSTVADLEAGLTAALNQRAATVTVDMAAVTFLDSSGIAVLVAAHHRAAADGIGLVLTNCSAMVRRVLEITGVWKILTGQTS